MSIQITVCVGWAPRQVLERSLDLERGATVAQALAELAQWTLPDGHAMGLKIENYRASIWGKPATATAPLRAGDRLELVRGLRVDPMVARRERFAQQGSRSTGLFSKKRPNAKPGY